MVSRRGYYATRLHLASPAGSHGFVQYRSGNAHRRRAACRSFISVAVADLVPELHRQRRVRDADAQLVRLLAGIGTVQLIGLFAQHSH